MRSAYRRNLKRERSEAKEFFAAHEAQGNTAVLGLLARPPRYVPERASVAALIGAFREGRTQMLFVVDEYGGVEGLITLRDVVDELFADVEPGEAER